MIDESFWKGKRVLVAGGAGMIGSHLARYLAELGSFVSIADNLSSGSIKNLDYINGMIIRSISKGSTLGFAKVDLRNFNVCQSVTRNMDVVFQLAANMGGIQYISQVGAPILHDSALININMLQAAQENGVGLYFFSSSACMYPLHLQTSANVVPLKESDGYPAEPDHFYGWEKVFSEKLCEAYQHDYGMQIRIGRFHNVYGSAYTAFDRDKGKAPCHLIIKSIRHPDPPFVVWGDGQQTRSFLYIDDCVEAVLRLMQSDYDKPVNIGTDDLVTIDELARMIIRISGKDIEIQHDTTAYQGVRGRNADLTLVQEVLGWRPQVKLEEGLSDVYEWALEHYSELEGI